MVPEMVTTYFEPSLINWELISIVKHSIGIEDGMTHNTMQIEYNW
jgi:hypothetical protein